TDTTAPYSFTIPSAAAGSYIFTAKATDSAGATAISAAVNVTVNPPANVPPTVSVTSPANGATFRAPASITINANAADSDGAVTKVDFFSGSTLIGTDTTAPYSFVFSNVAAGTYSLTAVATDNSGAATTSAVVTVTVNAPGDVPPAVSITSPVGGATFTAPANVTITANASDSDGTVTRVDFFNGATLLGTVTTAPYSFALTNLAAGMYTLTAKATDNGGAATTSAPVTITVNGVVGSCGIVYKIVNQWPGGFQAEVDVTNTGPAIAAWTVAWAFPNGQTITQLWNGAVTQTGANVSVTNLSYNNSIPTEGTVTFGFLAMWNNATNGPPPALSLNGITCH
ncbi:MAG: Ig-like domain-containing protein, partial [Blastocatellia bacterium]